MNNHFSPVKPIEWVPKTPISLFPGHIRFLDQTRLPGEVVYLETSDVHDIWKAIKTLQIRGAPAIGVAAAMGLAVVAQSSSAQTGAELADEISRATDYLASARPTAVNLFWALARMKELTMQKAAEAVMKLKELLVSEAVTILEEDRNTCRAIGKAGIQLLKDGCSVLTHCNAGSLATSQFGTALAPVYMAHEQGKRIHVYATETRPLLQGSRLTAWELMQAGINVTLICDNMVAEVMKEGRIDLVMVGADRIVANGDFANKIGTYGVAVLAKAHHIPFYVLAPTTTFDLSINSGNAIPIEERSADEITHGFGMATAPKGVNVYSPAFDVTPASYITGIICEKGFLSPPFKVALKKAASGAKRRARSDKFKKL